jgi:hypothetical protein
VGGTKDSYLQVPSSASARSTMRCTRARTVLSSSSVLNISNAWKFPVVGLMARQHVSALEPLRFFSRRQLTVSRVAHDLIRDARTLNVLLGLVHELRKLGDRNTMPTFRVSADATKRENGGGGGEAKRSRT